MRSLVIFGCIVAVTMAQRPSFAGTSAKGYPELASRFQDTSNSETPSISNNLSNRVGEVNKPPTEKLPPANINVANRFNEQPKDARPYRLLNHTPVIRGRQYHTY